MLRGYWLWLKSQQRQQMFGRGPTLPVLLTLPLLLGVITVPIGVVAGLLADDLGAGVRAGAISAVVGTLLTAAVARRRGMRDERSRADG